MRFLNEFSYHHYFNLEETIRLALVEEFQLIITDSYRAMIMI